MKHLSKLPRILTALSLLLCINSYGQSQELKEDAAPYAHQWAAPVQRPLDISRPLPAPAMNPLPGKAKSNYRDFTAPKHNLGVEATAANSGYEHHPEFGLLYPGAPCKDCYELIGKRTETTKTFEKVSAKGGKDEMVQTSTLPMHYRDAAGNWRTIKTNLEPATGKGIYEATEQPVPVTINAQNNFASLGNAGEHIQFNNKLELVYLKPDGTEVSLGMANWTNHTAGDEGAYITNAWPGIDMEMSVMRGAVKTNFYINHSMPAYADG